MTTNQDPRPTADMRRAQIESRYADLKFAPPAIPADRSRNFARTSPRTTRRKGVIR